MTPTALVALSRTPVCVGSGHHPRGLGPQGAGARRERDARSDDDAPRLRPPPVAQGGAHRRLPAHDHTDGGAHRDPAGARGGGKTRCADEDGSLWHWLEVSGRPAGATTWFVLEAQLGQEFLYPIEHAWWCFSCFLVKYRSLGAVA